MTTLGAPSITFKKANLRLEVTPQITPDGNVVLDVDVSKDSKGEATQAGFAINNQHVNTRTMIENGGTVVLGGIYQQSETNNVNKVPLLGDMPLLGYLFKSTAHETSKTELLIFLTPKIVTDKALTGH
jgi:type IV pilus assembly protein PilQ